MLRHGPYIYANLYICFIIHHRLPHKFFAEVSCHTARIGLQHRNNICPLSFSQECSCFRILNEPISVRLCLAKRLRHLRRAKINKLRLPQERWLLFLASALKIQCDYENGIPMPSRQNCENHKFIRRIFFWRRDLRSTATHEVHRFCSKQRSMVAHRWTEYIYPSILSMP